VLFWRGRLSVSSKQGNVKRCLPAFRVWEVWVGKDWRRFQGLIAVNEFVQWLRRGVGRANEDSPSCMPGCCWLCARN